ncbi:hypothetical protein [Xanthobacter tagetidis]|nr:hypothetical protein [Xanthobacter tagetidis]
MKSRSEPAPGGPGNGAMAAALLRAGYDTDAARLHDLAVRMLRRNRGNLAAAARGAAAVVREDAGLLRALFGAEAEARLEAYLRQVAADMAGPGAPPSPETGQASRTSHEDMSWTPALRRPVGGEEGHAHPASFEDESRVPSSPPPDRSRVGQQTSAAEQADKMAFPARAPTPSIRPGQLSHASHEDSCAPPAPDRPLPGHARRGAAGIAAVQGAIAKSLFDTFTVEGTPIGAMTFGMARRLARRTGIEHHVLSAIIAHVQAPDSTTIREAIREETLRTAIIEAERRANAG